jgi:hypothetical protein
MIPPTTRWRKRWLLRRLGIRFHWKQVGINW